jgi:hypothetical protein
MRVDVQRMRHGKLKVALKDIAAIATKARTRRRADVRAFLFLGCAGLTIASN